MLASHQTFTLESISTFLIFKTNMFLQSAVIKIRVPLAAPQIGGDYADSYGCEDATQRHDLHGLSECCRAMGSS